MSDADGDPPERKHKPGAITLLVEKSEQDRKDREAAILRDDIKDESTLDRLEAAYKGRAEAAEAAVRLWFRLALAMIAVLAMLVAGVVAVGAGVEIPGVGSFTVSKGAQAERAAPGAEAHNEAIETLDGEPSE